MNNTVDALLGSSVFTVPTRAATRHRLRAIAYHDVRNAEAFARQLDLICAEYHVVSAADVLAWTTGRPLPPHAVWITFDDGDPSVVANALPVLAAAKAPATVFVCPALIDAGSPPWWRVVEAAGARGIGSDVDGQRLEGRPLVRALKRVPEANASYTPEGIAMHHHADIAMAVAVPGGLITPIIFGAETKGLAEIAKEAKDLAERARTKKLKPEEFQGGTFSVSNLGMFGIKSFASIINEPQGAIMSVGAGEQRPVVKNGEIKVATVMTVTLTCDHRVVDGSVGAKFLAAFKPLIEEPLTLIV